MYRIYNLKLSDFINESTSKYVHIIKSDNTEFITKTKDDDFEKHFTLFDFQEMVEYTRYCFLKSNFEDVNRPFHYKRRKLDKEEFANIFNTCLHDLKDSSKEGLNEVDINDIEECYYLCKTSNEEEPLNNILAIASLDKGYLAFDYFKENIS